MVVTGEGRIDRQTAFGKAPKAVADAARAAGVPVLAICGSAEPDVDPGALGFAHIVPVTPPGMPLRQALQPDVARRCIADCGIFRNFASDFNE